MFLIVFTHKCRTSCLNRSWGVQKCAKRVETDETGEAHCTGQFFDFWKCQDACVSTHMLLSPLFHPVLVSVSWLVSDPVLMLLGFLTVSPCVGIEELVSVSALM
jgi:hypothetical protein